MSWKNRKISNLAEEYWKTKNHPHRKQIINILRKLQPWSSLLEIGCNCGMNLSLIDKKFKGRDLRGTDINKEALDFAKKKLPNVKFFQGEIEDAITFGENDIILIDAVLLYVSDKDIEKAIKRITHSAKKAIILCEWYDKDKLGVIKEEHWARNYPELFKDFGWKCRMKNVIWPESKIWQIYGQIIIATK